MDTIEILSDRRNRDTVSLLRLEIDAIEIVVSVINLKARRVTAKSARRDLSVDSRPRSRRTWITGSSSSEICCRPAAVLSLGSEPAVAAAGPGSLRPGPSATVRAAAPPQYLVSMISMTEISVADLHSPS
jgi:hypothetical protein